MKISVNHIRYYRDLYKWSDDLAPEGAPKLIEKIGAQLGGVEEVIQFGKKYEGALIVKVVSCEQHPNADRLHVCLVDDRGKAENVPRNDQGLVQVVCGAPNVAAGVTAVWLPPGATVPSTYDKDPFVLEARELRGVVSNGMMASPKELALGDSHDGILLIDEEVQPGTAFADQYNLREDVVIDIENKMFTHRPDLFGWMGVAREIAGIQQMPFTSPDWYRSDARIAASENNELPLVVRNEISELVPRFTAVTLAGITIGPSPVWLQIELSRYGIRPINNIVDLTNYYMVQTGQPLHAYDYDKVLAQDTGADHATLVIRAPHDGEKLQLLNGKEIEPRSNAILIATESHAIGLGGVMGGASTEIDANTRNVILECATFDMYSIRKTSMHNGIFSDAVTRFNKGQSPLQNMAILAKIVDDVQRLTNGKVASNVVDDNHLSGDIMRRDSLHPDIHVTASFINDRLGLKLYTEQMAKLLTNVEFKVAVDDETLTVRSPFWRTDIEIPEDIVEEIGRLYGYDNLPLDLPRRSILPAAKNNYLEVKSKIRKVLSSAGANELLTYSFVHGSLLESAGQDKDRAFKLSNALSPDLQYFRQSLTPSLLDKVHGNIKAGYDEFVLFEIGKAHIKGTQDYDETDLPDEMHRISLVYAASPKAVTSDRGAAYYAARRYVDLLIGAFKIDSDKLVIVPARTFEGEIPAVNAWLAPYDRERSALVFYAFDSQPESKNTLIGIVGELKNSVRKSFKLPAFTAAAELDVALLGMAAQESGSSYTPLSKYPATTQDITLQVPAETSFRQVYDVVSAALASGEHATNIEPLDIFQKADTDRKNITFRIQVVSNEKTLTDTEVSDLLSTVAETARDQLGAERI